MSPTDVDLSETLADDEDVEFEHLEKEEQDIPASEFEDEEELSEKSDEYNDDAEPVVETEEPQKEAKASPESAPKPDDRKLTEDLKAILTHFDNDETIKSKGLEVKLTDFKPEEIKGFIQKGFRFYQHMEELSTAERAIREREVALGRDIEQIQDLKARLEFEASRMATDARNTMPQELEFDPENDTPETVAMKKAAQETYQANAQLYARLNEIESGFSQARTLEHDQRVMDEIESNKADFPMASPEETIAVHHLSRGKIPIRSIMQKGQQIYGSVDFVDKVFKNCPDVRKHFSEKFTKEYLAKRQAVSGKRVPLRPSGAGLRSEAGKSKKAPITFDNVGTMAKKAIAEADRIERGEEL